MSLRVCVFAVAMLVQLTPAIAAPAATFQAGEDALIATHFDEARSAYAAAAASAGTSAKDRAAALRQLGVMAWRLKDDAAGAERYFADALNAGADLSTTHVERARFYASVHRFNEAVAAAEAAVATASNTAERQAAALACAQSILAKLHGVAIAHQSGADLAQLTRARALLHPYSDAPPMPLDLGEALLEIALRLDDGPLALVAWRSYAREGAQTGAWVPAAQLLDKALPLWRKGAMTPQVRNDIVEGLRISQFFDLAALVATDERIADTSAFAKTPRVAEAIAYANTLEDVRSTTDRYYRDVANGAGNSSAWHAALSAAGKKLWTSLALPGAYSDEAFGREATARFGALINIGSTGGVDDLHYGHVFIDDPRAIEQYGHKASIRRVAIDRIVSNGYESWVWDGRQAHGGWADSDRVIQVRPGYADGALRIWDRMTDPAQRAEVEQRLPMLAASDDAVAAREPGVFLPGLATRLEWQGENAILDRLKARGLSGSTLKSAFLIEQSRIKLDSNFFAHEGRHVLDHQAFGDKLEAEELEFRAKLSEIAFCEEPRVAFGSIFNPNIADATSPHGRANKRIAAGIVAWMDAHRTTIAGLDAKRPLLPQFDKLTSDQMRAAMRAMDPWAPKT